MNTYRSFFIVIVSYLLNVAVLSGQIVAGFSFSPDNACAGTVVSFQNNSTGAQSFLWDFGDGNTSEEENPTHNFFPSSGDGSQNFSVTLTAYQGDEEDSQTKTVSVLRPPGTELIDPYNWPAFSRCSGSGNLELTVQNYSNSTNTLYHIDWGDDTEFSSSEFVEEQHDYAPGFYELEFTVTGDNGCVASETYPVLNGSNPAIGVTGPEGSVGCAIISLDYEITGVDANIGTDYRFSFNDGSEAYTFTQENIPNEITHEFTEASCGGSEDFFTLTARAENQCGYQQITVEPIRIDREPIAIIHIDTNQVCVDDPIRFYNHSEPVCGGNPNLTEYTWNFDGHEETVGNSTASQTYEFDTPGNKTITLEALNTSVTCEGGFSFDEIIITVFGNDQLETPVDWLINGDDTGCQGAEFTFSITEVENATHYEWILPDGTEIINGEGTNEITVIFSTKTTRGEVEITVIAGNQCSFSEPSEPFYFTILPLPGPISEIQGVDNFCEGQENIENYSIEPLEVSGDITWQVPTGATINSGQGTTEIEVHFSESFDEGYITIYAFNDCGDTPEEELFISLLNLPEEAHGLTGPDEVCQNDSVTFYVQEIDYATSYRWLLNDNELTELEQREVTLFMDGDPGEYTISVLGINDCGEGEPDEHVIVINSIPEPDFDPQDHCFGQPALFTSNNEHVDDDNIESMYWSFGDGYSSTRFDPVHVYDTIGEFLVTLEVASKDGCKAYILDTIIVYDIPVSRFYANPDTVFIGQPVQFVDESYLLHDTLQEASDWFYDFDFSGNPDEFTSREQHPYHVYNNIGTYTVMQEVNIPHENEFEGCPDYSFVEVVVVMDFFMPNAFAPGGGGGGGGDGVIFFGPIIGGDGFLPDDEGFEIELEFSVFNRWGERVYYEKSTNPRWNGTIRGGPIAPQGVYVWRVMYRDGQGKTHARTGNVMLLK